MSLHAKKLNDIISATLHPSWKSKQKKKHIKEIDFLLFSMSSATMNSEKIREMRHIRTVLGPAPIFELPTEILWTIFDLLSHKDREHFRQANKQICATVKMPFAQTLPSDWRFVLTEESMGGLIKLTRDPDFVRYCKSIFIGTAPTTSKDRTRQPDLLQSGYHIEALIKSLKNLQMNDRTKITLGVYDNSVSKRKPFAPEASYGRTNSKHIQHTLAALGIAIRCTKFVANKIYIKAREGPAITKSADMFWTDLDPTPDIHLVLGRNRNPPAVTTMSARRLRLTMEFHCIMRAEDDNPGRYIKLGKREYGCLQRAPYSIDYQEKIFNCIHTNYESFLELIRLGPVEKLGLINIVFFPGRQPDPVALGQFWQLLKNLTTLEHLLLISLRDDKLGWIQADRVYWQGREEIQAGLEGLVKKTAHW